MSRFLKIALPFFLVLCVMVIGCSQNDQNDIATPTTPNVVDQPIQLTDAEVTATIESLLTGDTRGFDALSQVQREQVIQIIVDQRIYPDKSVDPTIGDVHFAEKSLPDCGGYPAGWYWRAKP